MFNRKHRKRSSLFIDRAGTCAIVVPLHYNGRGGFLYESDPVVLRPLPAPEELGLALNDAMNGSQVKPERSHRGAKLTDWPAYKASGARSVKRFEADFVAIHVSGANEENIIYLIEGYPEKNAELRVLASANPKPPAQLGERCIDVWRACCSRSL